MKNNYLAIIPARYASSRFPGKPLARLGGKEVILHVAERVNEAGIIPVVATDDSRIFDVVTAAGVKAVMTRADHVCGTDRVHEAYGHLCADPDFLTSASDVIINVQGDEPFVLPEQLTSLITLFESDPTTRIATLACEVAPTTTFEELSDPNKVKVVEGDHHRALYFSRSPLPYLRGVPTEEWTETYDYLFHIGVYAYTAATLQQITALPPSPVEKAESLEQLRWLASGLPISLAHTRQATIGIDTPADLEAAEAYLQALRQ